MASSSSSSPVSTEGSSSVAGTSLATDHSSSTLGLNVDGVGGTVSTSEKKRLQLLSQLSANRFERISSLLKVFKLSCPNWANGEKWDGLHIQLPGFAAVIEPLTANSYVMVLSADEQISMCLEYRISPPMLIPPLQRQRRSASTFAWRSKSLRTFRPVRFEPSLLVSPIYHYHSCPGRFARYSQALGRIISSVPSVDYRRLVSSPLQSQQNARGGVRQPHTRTVCVPITPCRFYLHPRWVLVG